MSTEKPEIFSAALTQMLEARATQKRLEDAAKDQEYAFRRAVWVAFKAGHSKKDLAAVLSLHPTRIQQICAEQDELNRQVRE